MNLSQPALSGETSQVPGIASLDGFAATGQKECVDCLTSSIELPRVSVVSPLVMGTYRAQGSQQEYLSFLL